MSFSLFHKPYPPPSVHFRILCEARVTFRLFGASIDRGNTPFARTHFLFCHKSHTETKICTIRQIQTTNVQCFCFYIKIPLTKRRWLEVSLIILPLYWFNSNSNIEQRAINVYNFFKLGKRGVNNVTIKNEYVSWSWTNPAILQFFSQKKRKSVFFCVGQCSYTLSYNRLYAHISHVFKLYAHENNILKQNVESYQSKYKNILHIEIRIEMASLKMLKRSRHSSHPHTKTTTRTESLLLRCEVHTAYGIEKGDDFCFIFSHFHFNQMRTYV